MFKEWWKKERGYWICYASFMIFYIILRLINKHSFESEGYRRAAFIAFFIILRFSWDWFLKRWLSL